ncbi:MAG: TadE/TadG family type IV pilus assembly protein [Betaproteobacteria bacterium]
MHLMAFFSRFSRLARDQRGVSAVEFALLAPVMIGLYLGVAEVSDGVAADRKVSLTSAALANLTSQVATIATADMTNILDASSAIISPFSASKLKMTVTCINIDASKVAKVKWSVTRGGSANSGTISIPSALAVASTQLILAEVSYAYTPTVGYTITGTLTLSDKMYMSPRITAPTYGATTCT